MTTEEKELFKRFINDDVYHNDISYKFTMKSGDVFIVKYDGEGESDINPFTGDDDYYYGFVFQIIKVLNDSSGNYCDDAFVEISKYDYPIEITKIY